MGFIADKLTQISFGNATPAPTLSRCSINTTTGAVTGINADGGTGLCVSGDFAANNGVSAQKVWNAVWNDVADFQLLNGPLEYGKCYMDTKDGAQLCSERCQMSVIGIASDTFGFGVGRGANPEREVPIAVAGWVLAHVDQEYPCGTPLTNDENGQLTEMTRAEIREYPERIVGLYKRKEMDQKWGPEGQQIDVNDRHWVKVK